MPYGKISAIDRHANPSHGRIVADDGTEVSFHKDGLSNATFGPHLVGKRVVYGLQPGQDATVKVLDPA